MTPKTQSVCKHCQHVHQSGRVTCGHFIRKDPYQGEIHCGCVAEPASTEEPPPYCPVLGCPRYYGQNVPHDHTTLKAARPSEPSAPPVGTISSGYTRYCDEVLKQPCGTISAPQTSADPTCQKCVEGIHGHCSGDCECRLSKCNLKVSAPQPVSGDAPDSNELVKALRSAQMYIRAQQPTWAKAEDLPPIMHEIGGVLSRLPAGDAPKVEEIAHEIFVYIGDNLFKTHLQRGIVASLRPYFPPASQTPQDDWTQAAAREICDSFPPEQSRMQSEFMAEIIRKHATPASTARTDGWVSVQERYPESQVHMVLTWDGGDQYTDYIDPETGDWAHGRRDRITHWRELPAAPGRVPQAQEGETTLSAQVALDANHPMMVAWKQFTATAEYSNALKWALADEYDDGRKISEEMRRNHVEGAMWLAFTKHFDAVPQDEPHHCATFPDYKPCPKCAPQEKPLKEGE